MTVSPRQRVKQTQLKIIETLEAPIFPLMFQEVFSLA